MSSCVDEAVDFVVYGAGVVLVELVLVLGLVGEDVVVQVVFGRELNGFLVGAGFTVQDDGLLDQALLLEVYGRAEDDLLWAHHAQAHNLAV